MTDKVMEKLITVVDGPLGLIAIILIFFIAKRLFNLEEWVRNHLSDTLSRNTEAIQKMIDHCGGKR